MSKKRSKRVEAYWLDRNLMVGRYLVLCTSQALFDDCWKRMGLKDRAPDFVAKECYAQHHYLHSPEKGYVSIVGIDCATIKEDGGTGIEIAALLAHEAVHVWQTSCDDINERSPSREFEAYSIQNITLELLKEYVRQVGP